ncbi:carbohydrate ABC transporter substrate-binding protein, CUT1 family [Granulicatella balaenopterae]|uniref:Carbohydrate ABC transporter substrate-binding protein, CUT1 family n=1 Tax=Granulicatella balaenopterae TaxID=137733 RepID=A0A1H9KDA5_9LACT|nr:ABC transporter substrate-binding protein [Granulicatella balaenopterae]SEQ97062.1 carbohydrate ABC transporter substrate-binding protein, CUT1 family [Granulicatella balaenopterae]
MVKWKTICKLTGSAMLVASLAACSNQNTESGTEAPESNEPTTLLMYQIGTKPENFDQLMEIANKRIEEKINAKIDLQYIGWGDWDDKMNTIIATGENYDIAFANKYVQNSQKGAFADLTELIPKYAKEAYDDLDPAYIKGNLVDGKLYAYPVNGNVFAQQMLSFNKELVDKYDLDISGINSYADADKVLREFHEKDPDTAAFGIGQTFNLSGKYDYPITKDMPFAVRVDGDSSEIINQYTDDAMMADLKLMHQWYTDGLIPAGAATDSDSYSLDSNTWFMREETQGPMDYGDTILTNAAGKEIVSRAITPALKTTAQAQMANFVVANVSKNKEKAAEFLALLNTDKELLNGLVWGVEGEAWEKDGEDRIKLLDGYKPNYHMSAWNTGNNYILYTQDTITDEMIEKRDKSIAEAKESPILGFNFDTSNVKTELTNIANVMNRYKASVNTGTVDPEVTIPKMTEDLKAAGWDKVRDEIQKQYDEFLKQ